MKDCEGGIEEVQNGYRGSESPSTRQVHSLEPQLPRWDQPGKLCLRFLLKSSTHKSLDLLTLDRVRLVTMEPGTEKGQVVVRVRKGCLELGVGPVDSFTMPSYVPENNPFCEFSPRLLSALST